MPRYEFGRFHLDTDSRLLFRDGALVSLPPKVVETLLILVENEGALVEKDVLIQKLWPDSFVEEHNLTHYVSVLRKVLGNGLRGQANIQTIPKRGYRFIGDLSRNSNCSSQDDICTEGPPAAPEPPPAKPGSARFRIAVIGALVVLLAVSVSVIAFLVGRRQVAPIAAVFTRLTDAPGPELFVSLSPDASMFAYASRTSGNWDIHLQRVGGRNSFNLTADCPAHDLQPAFSPDGKSIAFRSDRDRGGIFVMGATGESVRKITNFGYYPAWSPDGKELVFSTENFSTPEVVYSSELWRANVATGEVRRMQRDGREPDCSPDGRWVAFWTHIDGQRDLFLAPMAGGDAVRITNDPYLDWNPVWSRDGRWLYFASDRGGAMNLWRVRIDSRSGRAATHPEPLVTPSPYLGHISVAQDGRHIAYVQQVRTFNLYKVGLDPVTGQAIGRPVAITEGLREAIYPQVSPDGKQLVFTSWGKQEDLFTVQTDGSDTRQLTSDLYKDRGPRWSPEGKRIIFQSNRGGRFEIWSINADGGGLQQLTQAAGVICPVPSPNGARIAYGAIGKGSFILQTGKSFAEQSPLSVIAHGQHDEWFQSVSWSPDGTRLAGVLRKADGSSHGIVVYSFATRTFDDLTERGESPMWLRDGRRLLFHDDGNFYLLDSVSRKARQVLSIQPNYVYDTFSVSPDDRWIYFSLAAIEADVWLMSFQ